MRPKDGFKRPFRTRPDQKYLFSQNDPFFTTMDPSRLICCGVVGLPQALGEEHRGRQLSTLIYVRFDLKIVGMKFYKC